MTFRYPGMLWLVLAFKWTCVASLESVEELLCTDMKPGSRIPHPEFCNVYIICTDHAAMQISCERRVLYNSETELCDPEYQMCFGGLIREQDGTIRPFQPEFVKTTDSPPKFEFTTKEQATTTTTISSVQFTSQQPLGHKTCPTNDSDKLLLISHSTKCSVYFICYHGKPIPMECSQGLYWSERNYKCVPKELSECHTRYDSQHPLCPPVGIDFLPHDTFCDRFWFCRNGFAVIQRCDLFLQWDVNERKCIRMGQATCYTDLLKSLRF